MYIIDSPDNEGKTPLFIASFYGHLKMVQVLLGKNALIDKACNYGLTPLMVAAQQGHLDTVLLLLSHKANVHLAFIFVLTHAKGFSRSFRCNS